MWKLKAVCLRSDQPFTLVRNCQTKGAKMTKPFKVNLDKVSKTVQQFVADVAKTEGSKKKIDSQREFEKLNEYLCGSANSMNKDELGYIQGLMIEYQQKQFDNSVTENTKKEVSKIAKRMGDKKTIDTDEEAHALALMLRNSHLDLNQADICYIKNLLINSGYANYFEQETQPVTIVNIQIQQKESEENKKTEENVNNVQRIAENTYFAPKPKRKDNNESKEANRAKKEADRATKEADRSAKEADRSKAEADRATKEADRAEANADKAKKEVNKIQKAPKVSESARAQGFGIANKIEEELHDFWTNNENIEHELNKVNSSNAYSFVGKMMAVSDNHNTFGSYYKRVSASSICHVVLSLLNQAKKIGLGKDNAYTTLQETYNFLKRQYQDKNPGDPIYDERDVQELDIQIKHLYNAMSKVYK